MFLSACMYIRYCISIHYILKISNYPMQVCQALYQFCPTSLIFSICTDHKCYILFIPGWMQLNVGVCFNIMLLTNCAVFCKQQNDVIWIYSGLLRKYCKPVIWWRQCEACNKIKYTSKCPTYFLGSVDWMQKGLHHRFLCCLTAVWYWPSCWPFFKAIYFKKKNFWIPLAVFC